MKDFVKKYQKNKLFTNINIVIVSLVLAVGINVFVIDGTDIGNKLKTSVLNSNIKTEIKSNLYIQNFENDYYIISGKDMNDVNSISLSITYNPENVSLQSTDSQIGDVTNLTNTPGISSLILTTNDNVGIKSGEKIIKLTVEKKEDKSENLNIMNANFKDANDQHFELSTSGITF